MKKTYLTPRIRISRMETEQMLAASKMSATMNGTSENIILEDEYSDFSAGSKEQKGFDDLW